jgi:hemoglobin
MRTRMFVMAAVTAVSLMACGGKGKGGSTDGAGGGSAVAEKSLYDRLGGKDAITAVVEDFVGNVAGDKRINAFFANADIPHLKQMLVDQICEATGGPCKYTGKDMKTSHNGMNVKDADFNALVEDLVKSLDKFKVPEKEKGELLGALSKMHDDIVTAK